MKPLPNLLLALALLSATHLPARAAVFDPKQIPADAKWVIHVDMDATRKTKTWEIVSAHIAQNPDAQTKIDALSNLMGLRFPTDVHGMTLYGSSFADHSGVVLLNATLDTTKITALLQANVAYKKITYNSHDILSWLDKNSGKTMFGSFATPSLAVLGDTVEQVQSTLDVLDGKSKSLTPDDTLAQGKGTTVLFYLAGTDLSSLPTTQKPESPLLSQLTSAWFTISQEDQKIVVRAALIAKDADAADNIKSMAEGFRSFILLSASGDSPDAHIKFAASIIQALALKLDGTTLNAELPVSMDNVASIFDNIPKHPPVAPPASGN